jgi:universal stress protein E
MKPFKSVLVDIDAAALAQPVLERAVRLARSSGAKLTITDVMTGPAYARPDVPAAVEEEMVTRRRLHLAHIAHAVTDVRVEAKLLIGRPATVLIQEVLRSGHDLLIRSHARDLTAAGPQPCGPIDIELLRNCPCPVMLVNHASVDHHPQIAAAVTASADEESQRVLNAKIVNLALLIAELEGGVPMVLQSWVPFAESLVRSHSSADGFAAYVEDMRQHAAADLRRLVQMFGGRLAGAPVVRRRGQPEDVIPPVVVDHGIDLVVMAAVARGGVAGLLSGNTAERVLRKLPCSVLAVKPDRFMGSIRHSQDPVAQS